METKTENMTQPAIIETKAAVNFFSNKETFEHVQRIAVMFSKSDLVPARYKGNIGNCIIAIEMAERMGAGYLMVMQNLDIIQGKPGFSSTFLIACINACGKFSPLRYEEDEKDGGRTRAWAFDKANNEKIYSVWVSMTMAKNEGWIDKAGSKWKTMPELIRRYRAASFFQRQYAPEISMGMHSTEELVDITPFQPAKDVNKEEERISLMIHDCKNIEELQALAPQVPDSLMNEYLDKKELLTAKK
jgi:hypothetical protein